MDAEQELVLPCLIPMYPSFTLLRLPTAPPPHHSTSPLLHLPIELIHKIFVLAVGLSNHGSLFWITLTAICHQIRESLICSTLPWTIIDTNSIPLAKLFLERCKFDPHKLFVNSMGHAVASGPTSTDGDDKAQFWEMLEDKTLNNLHSLMFDGALSVFMQRVIGLLQRAPNLSTLEVDNNLDFNLVLVRKWTPDCQLPHLTRLRLFHVLIDWNTPILQNLTELILNYTAMPPSGCLTSVQIFLSILKNCPGLEELCLISAGPVPGSNTPDENQVVKLCKLKKLVLNFQDPYIVVCILSHIWFPGSTKVHVTTNHPLGPDIALSQLLPFFQCLQKATSIAITIKHAWALFVLATDTFSLQLTIDVFPPPNLESISLYVSKIVEIVGSDAVVILKVQFDSRTHHIPRGVWKELLHGLPCLKLINYDAEQDKHTKNVNPFCLAFSEPFRGGLVCPQLQDLRMPLSFTQDPTAKALKQVLLERDGCGRQLKWISLSRRKVGEMIVSREEEMILLHPFSDVVDKVLVEAHDTNT